MGPLSQAEPLLCRRNLVIVTWAEVTTSATATINSMGGLPFVLESYAAVTLREASHGRIDRKSSCNTSSNRGFRTASGHRTLLAVMLLETSERGE